MTTEEFSNEFDTLINSYYTTKEFGSTEGLEVDEYEKSLYLTKAQEEIIIELYNGSNALGYSFEKTEENRRYLSDLVKTYITSNKIEGNSGLSNNSTFFYLPNDLLFITYESVKFNDETLGCKDSLSVPVVPITQDDFYRISQNPFKGPNDRRAIRLDINNNTVEIVSKYNISSYLVRYISKPKPIILINLLDGLSINNIKDKTECELNPALHRRILERAVRIALQSKSINAGNK